MPSFNTIVSSSPLAGLLGLSTASFFRLDPTFTVPIEPLADIVPGVTPFRVTLSMVDAENHTRSYRITQNTLQDFTDTTPNVHRELIQIAITGTLSASPPMSLAGVPPPPTFGFRLDLLQMANLERMADERKPIMVVTPRVSLATCFVQSIQRVWAPSDGESTPVTITVIEARIATPFSTNVVPDTDTLAAGNAATSGGGEQSTTPSNTATSAPAVSQTAPSVGGF